MLMSGRGEVSPWAIGTAIIAGITSSELATFADTPSAQIPEPSSGLLLAIDGGGGLALRCCKLRAKRLPGK
jgi:hypothetical protein